VVQAPAAGETAQESWNRENRNWMLVATNNISLGSEDTYGTGINAFQVWCKVKSIDATLKIRSALYDSTKASAPYEVCTLGCFLSWLAFERKVSPGYNPHISLRSKTLLAHAFYRRQLHGA
jgi:predicted RNase H-like nuclease